ncbi:MAG: hypothetical protein EOP42_28215, partial [Sphingobacteriaceae bacterium]
MNFNLKHNNFIKNRLKNSIAVMALCLFTISVSAQQKFVKTKGSQFTIAGKPYYYIGTNYWYGG